jgi:hypothetical protein
MTDQELQRLEHDTLDELDGVMYRASLLHAHVHRTVHFSPSSLTPVMRNGPLPLCVTGPRKKVGASTYFSSGPAMKSGLWRWQSR